MNTPRRHLLRLLAHIMSLLIVLISAAWMWPDFSAFPAMEACSMIAGYLSFLLIGLTLLIGPIKSWLPDAGPLPACPSAEMSASGPD